MAIEIWGRPRRLPLDYCAQAHNTKMPTPRYVPYCPVSRASPSRLNRARLSRRPVLTCVRTGISIDLLPPGQLAACLNRKALFQSPTAKTHKLSIHLDTSGHQPTSF